MNKSIFFIFLCLSANFVHSSGDAIDPLRGKNSLQVKKPISLVSPESKDSEFDTRALTAESCSKLIYHIFLAKIRETNIELKCVHDDVCAHASATSLAGEFYKKVSDLWDTKFKSQLGEQNREIYNQFALGVVNINIHGGGLIAVISPNNPGKSWFGFDENFIKQNLELEIEQIIVDYKLYMEELATLNSTRSSAQVQHQVDAARHNFCAISGEKAEVAFIPLWALSGFGAISLSRRMGQLVKDKNQIPSYYTPLFVLMVQLIERTTVLSEHDSFAQNAVDLKRGRMLSLTLDSRSVLTELWKERFELTMDSNHRLDYDRLVEDFLKRCSVDDIFEMSRTEEEKANEDFFFNKNFFKKQVELRIQEQVGVYLTQRRKQEKEQKEVLAAERLLLGEKALALQQALLDEEKATVPRKKPEAQTPVKAVVAASLVTNASTTKTPQVAKKPTITAEEMQRRGQQAIQQEEKNVRCGQANVETAERKQIVGQAAAALKKVAREKSQEAERQQRAAAEVERKEEEHKKETLRLQAELKEAERQIIAVQKARERADAEVVRLKKVAQEAAREAVVRQQQEIMSAEQIARQVVEYQQTADVEVVQQKRETLRFQETLKRREAEIEEVVRQRDTAQAEAIRQTGVAQEAVYQAMVLEESLLSQQQVVSMPVRYESNLYIAQEYQRALNTTNGGSPMQAVCTTNDGSSMWVRRNNLYDQVTRK